MNREFKDLAVMLYVSSQEIGNEFHSKYLEPFDFPRSRYTHSKYYTDYHITIGYLHGIPATETERLREHLHYELTQEIDLPKVAFEFGPISLFGHPGHPFVVAFPKNMDDFFGYNKTVNEVLKNYEEGNFKLEHKTKPKHYFPHMNLYATLYKHIRIANISNTFEGVQKSLKDVELPMAKLRIDELRAH